MLQNVLVAEMSERLDGAERDEQQPNPGPESDGYDSVASSTQARTNVQVRYGVLTEAHSPHGRG